MNIKVKITRTRDMKPLMELNGGPFVDFTVTPAQLQMFAAALSGTADAIAEEDVTGKNWRPRQFTMRDVGSEPEPEKGA